ncbi:hypothetical protein HRbin30_01956 [bacterium HR30]|nr:hypothetical protein HRbin30_01956 [bacterium HR30]
MALFQRYLLRQLLFPTVASISVLAALLLVARLVKITSLLINRGLSLGEVMHLLLLLTPSFLEFSLPMGILIGTFLTLGRLAADGELIGAQACGVRPLELIAPLLVVGGVAALCTGVISLHLRPASRAATVRYLESLSLKRASAVLQEQVFFDQLPGIVVYAERIQERGRVLKGVFLADQRTPGKRMTIISKYGYLVSPDGRDEETILRLEDGILFSWNGRADTYEVSRFETFDWNLSESVDRSSRNLELPVDPKATNTGELLGLILRQDSPVLSNVFAAELSSRVALPFSCIVFAFLGWALSMRWQVSSTAGIGISSLCFLVYYLLDGLADSMAQQLGNWWFAAAGAWLPNGALGLACIAAWPDQRWKLQAEGANAVQLRGTSPNLEIHEQRTATKDTGPTSN